MPNNSSSVFGGSFRNNGSGNVRTNIMSTHKPKVQEAPSPQVSISGNITNTEEETFTGNEEQLKVLSHTPTVTIKGYNVDSLGTIVQILTTHKNGQITDSAVWVPFSEIVDNKVVAIEEEV